MTHLPVPPAEPCRTRGGAGGAARADLPPWHGQKVKVPARLWGGHYSAAAVRFWAQLAALDRRAEGCRAGVLTLAGYLGVSTRTTERYLAELAAPGPDGVPEMTTVRRTYPGGTGTTAERRMRPVGRAEHFAYVPVTAVKALRPTALVAYCVLAWAQAVTAPHTTAELAAVLAVTVRTASRLVDELEGLGWISVDRRGGRQGRHVITVHDEPRPDTDGGSGPDTDGGSLASREDAGLTDERSAEAGGSFRRRRADRSSATPRDYYPVTPSAGPPVAPAAPATFRPAVRPPVRPAYAGPPLTLSADAWALLGPVLAPVSDLLPRISAFMTRRIVRELLRQIRDEGIWPDDIRDQITRLRTWTPDEDIRDPGRWLLGAVLPVRSKCGMTGCHWGFLAHTGAPCKACADVDHRGRPRGHPPHTAAAGPPEPLRACPGCDAPYRLPLRHTYCRLCHTDLSDTA